MEQFEDEYERALRYTMENFKSMSEKILITPSRLRAGRLQSEVVRHAADDEEAWTWLMPRVPASKVRMNILKERLNVGQWIEKPFKIELPTDPVVFEGLSWTPNSSEQTQSRLLRHQQVINAIKLLGKQDSRNQREGRFTGYKIDGKYQRRKVWQPKVIQLTVGNRLAKKIMETIEAKHGKTST